MEHTLLKSIQSNSHYFPINPTYGVKNYQKILKEYKIQFKMHYHADILLTQIDTHLLNQRS